MSTVMRGGLLLAAVGVLLLTSYALVRLLLGSDFGWLGDRPGPSPEGERSAAELRRKKVILLKQERQARVMQGLRARRLTLLQAALEFRRIEEQTRTDSSGTPPGPPREPLEQALCREILDRIRAEVRDGAGDAALLAELEAEFVRLFGQTPNDRPPAPASSEAAAQ
jgi:hypothetical protein